MFGIDRSKFIESWMCLIQDILPKVQVQALQFIAYIVFFYKNAKKAKPKNEICLYDIRKHNVF